ncbi:OmpA/MotB domain protein [Burkholderia sp. 8Y]|uniref:OmpA family protein n=1 Tax=Burkholderia sp. 8Y TaxID=2653133 RepID=UPI0012F1BB57|nr:OmpA family protein [Burkholderia sp. 8Y]VXC54795.1 OmpA/MotB domain protein [Burkholderia sp. 8Y]
MSINLNQMAQADLNESVLQHLAARVGCAPESAKRVISLCGPALIGSMMNKASSLDGARNLFNAVMSPGVNTHIADELPHFVLNDDGMQTLLATSASVDGAVASHDNVNALSARIAEYSGVPAHVTRVLAGVVGATILGLLKRHFTQHNGQVGQLPTLLGHQLPVVRANMTDAFAQALGLGSVGGFLAGVASRLKAVSSHLEHPSTQEAAAFPIHSDLYPAPKSEEAQEKSSKRKWLWVANAAALALFAALVARGCSTEDKPKEAAQDAQADGSASASGSAASDSAGASGSAASDSAGASSSDAAASGVPVASQASMPTLLPGKNALASITVDASGVPTVKATVGSDEERQRLIDLLSARFGADKFHANVAVDPDTKPSTWLDKLDTLAPVMALPGARVQITGDKIELGGKAADTKLGWLDKLKALFGSGWNIGLASPHADAAASDAASAVASSAASAAVPASAATSASASANGEACSAPAIARMLNLKPINFRTGSNTPPASAMAALAKSAQALKACDEHGAPIMLQIAGYSDNTGSPALNVELSKKRAEAVRAYLVKHGIPANSLKAEGFGEVNPIADNSTPAGRLANRRIEFKEVN